MKKPAVDELSRQLDKLIGEPKDFLMSAVKADPTFRTITTAESPERNFRIAHSRNDKRLNPNIVND
jgi:hypothetical protein